MLNVVKTKGFQYISRINEIDFLQKILNKNIEGSLGFCRVKPRQNVRLK